MVKENTNQSDVPQINLCDYYIKAFLQITVLSGILKREVGLFLKKAKSSFQLMALTFF